MDRGCGRDGGTSSSTVGQKETVGDGEANPGFPAQIAIAVKVECRISQKGSWEYRETKGLIRIPILRFQILKIPDSVFENFH
jgi:hypothetical protein